MKADVVRSVAIAVAGISLVIGAAALVATNRMLEWLSHEAIHAIEVFGRLGFYGLLLVFLAQSYRLVRYRFDVSIDEATLPPRERPPAVPVPGDDLARNIEAIGDRTDDAYRAIRERLDRRLRDVFELVEHRSSADVERAIAGESWTDDDVASAALGGTANRPRTLTGRLLEAIGFSGWQARREIRRTMTAVVEAAGSRVDRGSSTGPPPEFGGRSRGRSATDGRGTEIDEEASSDDVGAPLRRWTRHWDGITAIALVAIVLGFLYQLPTIALAATVGIGFAAYARLAAAPELEVSVNRVVSDTRPEPGDDVDVTLRVRNEGDDRILDLRILDGVPPELPVTAGSPRLGTTLAAGQTAVVRYTVTARRGTFQFDPAHLVVRSVTGSVEVEHRVPTPEETTITARPSIDSPSSTVTALLTSGVSRTGTLRTTDPGPGTEFHSVREYDPGDPAARIDWKRYARSRELSTVSFHEERSAVAIVAIDVRSAAYHAPSESAPHHAVDRSVSGAANAFGALLDAGHRVGLTAIGAVPAWLPPNRGRTHRVRGISLLGTAEEIAPVCPESDAYDLSRFDRAPKPARVLLFTPLCDDESVEIARTLRGSGFSTTVVSTDPTSTTGSERAFAGVERRLRIETLRVVDIPVIDWPWDRSFDEAVGRET